MKLTFTILSKKQEKNNLVLLMNKHRNTCVLY